MKTKIINLFIASSATSELLNKQKESLIEKCRELNTEFAERSIDYYIKPIAYEDLERRMDVFGNHIENDDIVVFLIDGTEDPNLEEKLKVAAEKYRAGSKPELLVFVSNKIDEEYKQKIKVILKAKGWLYENLDIDSHDYFLTNVENRIKGYIAQSDEKNKQKKQKKRFYWEIGVIMAVLVFVCIGLSLKNRSLNRQIETKRLLIAGGGSARNYIEKSFLNNKSIADLQPDYWWYTPMPSGDSYRIIKEEIINLKEDYRDSPYYTIVVSAEKANDSCFMKDYNINERDKHIKEFKDIGLVVGIRLGYDDTLVVYGYKSLPDDLTIKSSDLDMLIRDTKISILRTSENSGTYKAYVNVCNSLKNRHGLGFFSSSNKIIDTTSWLVLGSANYKPVYNMKGVVRSSVIDDTTGTAICKPIYVYFMLYKKNKNSNEYILPDATKKFLYAITRPNDTNARDIIEKIDNPDSVNVMINKNPTTILYDNFHILKK